MTAVDADQTALPLLFRHLAICQPKVEDINWKNCLTESRETHTVSGPLNFDSHASDPYRDGSWLEAAFVAIADAGSYRPSASRIGFS